MTDRLDSQIEPPIEQPIPLESAAGRSRSSNATCLALLAVVTACFWGLVCLGALGLGAAAAGPYVAGVQATQTWVLAQTRSVSATSAAVELTGTAQAAWPLALSDSFATNDNDWTIATTQNQNDTVTLAVANDKYRWEIDSAQDFWIPVDNPAVIVSDFRVSIDINQLAGQDTVNYGLIFRVTPDFDFYYFGVNGRGEAFFGLFYKKNWIINLTFNPGREVLSDKGNHLVVTAAGSHYTFLINGHLIGQADDDHIQYGRLGLVAGGAGGGAKVSLEFDNFEVRAPLIDAAHAPTATAAHSLLAAFAQVPAVLSEDFDTNSSGWDTGQYSPAYFDGERTIRGGKYHWSVKAHSGMIWYAMPSLAALSDFYFTVTAQQSRGPADAAYGMVFRRLDDDNYYFWGIDNNRDFFVSLYYRGEWSTLLSRGGVPAIEPGQPNRLGIVAQGKHFIFFINDQYLADMDDARLERGQIGLGVNLQKAGDQADFDFDNVELRAPAPTPTVTRTPTVYRSPAVTRTQVITRTPTITRTPAITPTPGQP